MEPDAQNWMNNEKEFFKPDVGVETGYETMIKLNYLIWWKLLKFNWFKLLNAKLLRKAVI